MLLRTDNRNVEVPSPTMKILELPSHIDFDKSMEDHSQQNRWKLSKHLTLLPMAAISEVLGGGLFTADFLQRKVYNAILHK
jgi:hypothetical protein